MEKTLKDYAQHLQTCSLNQNWDEARQALSDTPTKFRDESYYIALHELDQKSMKCTCGLDKLLKPHPPVSLDTHTAEDILKNALIKAAPDDWNAEHYAAYKKENMDVYDCIISAMTEYASLRENNLHTKLNESLALIYKCENTLEKIGHIFNTLKDNSDHSALVQLVEAIDIDIPLIQAKIKDELDRLKKPSL